MSTRAIGRSGRHHGHPVIAVGAIVALLVLVAACGGSSSATPTPVPPTGLNGTSWRLTSYTTPDGSNFTVPASVTPGSTFNGGLVAGKAGCNTYTAEYTSDATTIAISKIVPSAQKCDDPLKGIEADFLAALAAVNTYSIAGNALTLTGTRGLPSLVYQFAGNMTLVGVTWSAVTISDGSGAGAQVLDGTTVTALFAADGTVSGSGGCNTYNGPYTTDGSKIKIGPLAGTKKACTDPAGVSAQEDAFLAAMAKADRYALGFNAMALLDANGAVLVSFFAS